MEDTPHSMDWFSWMSMTGLDPVIVYKYGLVLSRNELEAEDVSYFDHEFLRSMGISVAKHRLEIIKLARKQKGGGGLGASADTVTRPWSGFIAAINRTKKSFGKYIAKVVYPKGTEIKSSSKDEARNRGFSGPLVDKRVASTKSRNRTWSGPLYPVGSPRLYGRASNPRLLGPRDRMFPGRKVVYGRDSGEYDVDGQSFWVHMFHDMKPT